MSSVRLAARSFSSVTRNNSSSEMFTVGITGSSGLLGTALIDQLVHQTPTIHEKPIRVIRLVRSNSEQVQRVDEFSPTTVQIPWNPFGKGDSPNDWCVHPNLMQQLDAIVHLAGENVATSTWLPEPLKELGLHAWTENKKQAILDSRVIPTRNLVRAWSQHTSRPTTFLTASGVGIYGHDYHQTNTTHEFSTINDENTSVSQTRGFLAHVSREWEKATQIETDSNHHQRILQVRLAPILSTRGGALAKLLPVFKLGGGGVLGAGTQYFSFISARDAARAIVHLLQSSETGPVNLVAPTPCTNQEFTVSLGKILARPTIIPMPSFLVRLLFGEMGEEMLLGGVVAFPKKLLDDGFLFQHPNIESALRSALKENI